MGSLASVPSDQNIGEHPSQRYSGEEPLHPIDTAEQNRSMTFFYEGLLSISPNGNFCEDQSELPAFFQKHNSEWDKWITNIFRDLNANQKGADVALQNNMAYTFLITLLTILDWKRFEDVFHDGDDINNGVKVVSSLFYQKGTNFHTLVETTKLHKAWNNLMNNYNKTPTTTKQRVQSAVTQVVSSQSEQGILFAPHNVAVH